MVSLHCDREQVRDGVDMACDLVAVVFKVELGCSVAFLLVLGMLQGLRPKLGLSLGLRMRMRLVLGLGIMVRVSLHRLQVLSY